jgi:hypothetical protein
MKRDFWGFFHDGSIVRISGSVPGNVVVEIEIEYLRQMFEGSGDGFNVNLTACTKIEFSAYGEAPTSDMQEIANSEPEILYVNETEPEVILDCAIGLLVLNYADARVSLDSGRPVTYEELEHATKKYWNDWSERHAPAT